MEAGTKHSATGPFVNVEKKKVRFVGAIYGSKHFKNEDEDGEVEPSRSRGKPDIEK